ncbi:MAG: protein kinase domain-containing protein [Akkermansiaceae bacterium]
MSTERYEIKEKIGQGGVGAVYHAFDTQLNRDVAIKRVLAEGGYEDQGEATKHLLKEATALSSVQHPHIVTVYDAGIDDDGPYVVMELIHGRTLDQMVERGTLTWDDLREVALQSQEALIAAQDLDLVHRDLKPSNVMVCWLPSGKFQVKIVDFGLAKFSATPSLQTIDHGDAVFGSIFFMAPEQFERTPLDKRTDMYALGCLYYYALTGIHPFSGDTAAAVMASHLQHHVTPLHEIRPDIPKWGADWIMWHIERNMDDRPADSRAALERFLILDKQSTQPVTVTMTAPTEPTPDPGKPKFIFPGSEAADATPPAPASLAPATPPTPATPPASPTPPAPEAATPQPQTAPQPIAPPEGIVSPHTAAQQISAEQAEPEPTPTPSTPPTPEPTPTPAPAVTPPAPLTPATPPAPAAVTPPAPLTPATPPAPVSLATPAVATPPTPATPAAQAPATTPQISLTGAAPAQPAATPAAPAATPPAGAPPETPPAETAPTTYSSAKRGMPAGAKWAIVGMLILVVAVAVAVMRNMSSTNKEIELVNKTLADAKALNDDGKLQDGMELSEEALVGTLNRATSMNKEDNRALLLKVIAYAKGSGYDADAIIRDHIITAKTPESIRSEMFLTIMNRRKNVSNIAPLLEFAKSTEENNSAAEAIKAAATSAEGENADAFIDDFIALINDTQSATVRGAAERAAAGIISESDKKEDFATPIFGSYETAGDDGAKYSLLRLLATAGGEKANKAVTEALKSDKVPLQSAAIAALGNWADDSQFENLADFISETENEKLRNNAFDAAYNFLRKDRKRDPEDLGDLWKTLAGSAQTQREKLKIISGMANQKHEWAIPVLEYFTEDKDDKVISKAEMAKERLERRISENDSSDDEDE